MPQQANSEIAESILSRRMRAIREGRGWTQRELGERCQIDLNQISRYERGVVDPTIHTLSTIAEHLEVSTDYLLGLTDYPHIQVREPGLNVDERAVLEVLRNEGWLGIIRLGADRLSK